jgi:hypothetical protein
MFSPKPQGWGNPVFKHSSVREYSSPEIQLFDMVQEASAKKDISPAVRDLLSSIVEMRDMQTFLRDITCYDVSRVNTLLNYVGEGLAYYINRMHETDAKVFAAKCPEVLYEDMTLEQMYNGLLILIKCVDSACKVNCAVIKMSLKGLA